MHYSTKGENLKMEFKVVLTADDKLLAAINGLTNAIAGGVVQNVTTVQPTTKEETGSEKLEVPTVADKTMYFVHEGSGAAIVVKKGEDITFLENDIYDPIAKTEYDKILADEVAQDEKAKQLAAEQANADASTSEVKPTETEDHGITMEMIRAEATKLTSNGRQADFKAILTSFNAEKLSAVPKDKYPTFLTAIKEAVGED